MKNKKFFAVLLGIGVAATPYSQLFARGQAADAAMPPQVVSDGGVEAVREAQESAPAPVEKFEEARRVLKKLARNRRWKEGYDQKKKRIIVIESADFKTADPASDAEFFIKREMAAKKAVLSAKVSIIQYINQDMSAVDLVNMPGTDVNRALGAERELLNTRLAQQKEILVNMLEKVETDIGNDLLTDLLQGDRLHVGADHGYYENACIKHDSQKQGGQVKFGLLDVTLNVTDEVGANDVIGDRKEH